MGQTIELKASDGFILTAYQAQAAGKSRGTVVLMQDAFGVNGSLTALADAYAAQGFDVLAPSLFDRVEPRLVLPYDAAGIARGSGVCTSLGWEVPLKDVEAAVARLGGRRQVALVGYAWGGSCAYLAASRLRNLSCVTAYYGGDIVKNLGTQASVPLQFHFAARDKTITRGNIDLIRHHNPGADVSIYPA
ncbi:MAG TPA: dienelactone hydrolase family protein, partial [Myxococcota bacterium]|nr:dienelactone hydrolase family protein [Myxococcota bacterium]